VPLDEKLRKQWKSAGYERGHGSDAVLAPPPPGLKRLYYLTGPEHAISNIVFGRVKISRFSELNDPFELLGQNFGQQDIRQLVRAHKSTFNDSQGVICLSEDWVDPVLWSHYASKHKGLALGFDVDSTLVQSVKYSSSRLNNKIARGTKSITKELADLLTYTKYESWGYEREWRMLISLASAEKEGGLYFMPFGSGLKLKEVILGSLCDSDLRKVRVLVDQHHAGVKTYRARLALRSFRIIPNGSTVPQP